MKRAREHGGGDAAVAKRYDDATRRDATTTMERTRIFDPRWCSRDPRARARWGRMNATDERWMWGFAHTQTDGTRESRDERSGAETRSVELFTRA